MYPMDLECVWLIETEPSSRVELTIKDLDIESSRTDTCEFDFLRVSRCYPLNIILYDISVEKKTL